jgi:hypothetical protein
LPSLGLIAQGETEIAGRRDAQPYPFRNFSKSSMLGSQIIIKPLLRPNSLLARLSDTFSMMLCRHYDSGGRRQRCKSQEKKRIRRSAKRKIKKTMNQNAEYSPERSDCRPAPERIVGIIY